MNKKLSGNGLWESSRIILPQHKEAIIQDHLRHEQLAYPTLDEQAIEQIERIIIQSFNERRKVLFILFNKFGKIQVEGIVIAIQSLTREIKIATNNEQWKRINLKEVLSAIII